MRVEAPGRVTLIDVARDVKAEIGDLNQTLSSIEAVLDPARMREEVAELEAQSAAPDLWEDVERAQQVTSRLSYLQADLRKVTELRQRVDDLQVLIELAEEENDAEAAAEVERELDDLAKLLGELEVRTLLSGEYDHRDAVVTIRA